MRLREAVHGAADASSSNIIHLPSCYSCQERSPTVPSSSTETAALGVQTKGGKGRGNE